MIEVEENLNVEKVIVSANLENEEVVASPTKREKSKFVIMAPHQAFALVPKEGQSKQNIDQAFPKSLPHFYQSFPMQNGVGEGIKNGFKENDIVLEEMIETSVILDNEPKEQMPNWTSPSLLNPRSSCENIFKFVNIMSCHKLNEQNRVDAEESEDYNEKIMVPKHLVEEFRQFESHDKPNSEEIEIVN
uniref:Uncharacterized protein n=1 Tax=Solanum tuberosum TaxID=4113 RepID=M1DYJ1_SOLTU